MWGDGPDHKLEKAEAVEVRGDTRTRGRVYQIRRAHRERWRRGSCGLRLRPVRGSKPQSDTNLGAPWLSDRRRLLTGRCGAGDVPGVRVTRAGAALRCSTRQSEWRGQYLRRRCRRARWSHSHRRGEVRGCVTPMRAGLDSRCRRSVPRPRATLSASGDGGAERRSGATRIGDVLGVHRPSAHRAPGALVANGAAVAWFGYSGGLHGGLRYGYAPRQRRRSTRGGRDRRQVVPAVNSTVPLRWSQHAEFRTHFRWFRG